MNELVDEREDEGDALEGYRGSGFACTSSLEEGLSTLDEAMRPWSDIARVYIGGGLSAGSSAEARCLSLTHWARHLMSPMIALSRLIDTNITTCGGQPSTRKQE